MRDQERPSFSKAPPSLYITDKGKAWAGITSSRMTS